MSESVGTARVDIVGNTDGLRTELDKAGKQLQFFSKSGTQEFQRLDSATKRTTEAVRKQTETLGMSRAERVKYNIVTTTSGQIQKDLLKAYDLNIKKLNEERAAMSKSGAVFNEYGRSAKQVQQAMRQVPAQVTDIVVSLQGGQRPMTVLLQQGGQLKDVFGGVKPAVQALGVEIGNIARMAWGLVTPWTVLAGAIGLVGTVLYKASRDQENFNVQLSAGGNYAAVQAQNLQQMVSEVSAATGASRGQSLAALGAVAETGRFTAEQFDMVSQAVARTVAATGGAADEMVERYTALAKDPVEALLKLNETEHFLEEAQIRRIETLIKEGRKQEAVTEAIKLASGAAQRHAEVVVESRSIINTELDAYRRQWGYVTRAITAASDAWTVARDNLARNKDAMATMDALLRFTPLSASTFAGNPFRNVESSTSTTGSVLGKVDSAEYRLRVEQEKAAAEAVKRARENLWSAEEKNYTRQEKLLKDLGEMRRDAALAGLTETQIAAKEEAIRARHAKEAAKEAAKGVRRPGVDPAESLLASIRKQIEANRQMTQSTETLSASERLAISVKDALAEKGSKMSAANRALLQSQLAVLDQTNSEVKAAKALAEQKERLLRLDNQLEASRTNRERQNEAEIAGMVGGANVRERLERQLEIHREYESELKKLRDKGVAESSGQYQELEARARQHRDAMLQLEAEQQQRIQAIRGSWQNGAKRALDDYLYGLSDISGQSEQLFTGMFNTVESAIQQMARTGKLAWKDMLVDMAAQFLAFQTKMAIANALMGAAQNGAGQGTWWGEALKGFAGMMGGGAGPVRNAKGGVYNSPSLSAYSGQVHSTPKLFAFAKGAGVFGEAGPEAIMPLSRGPDGKLGVQARGAPAGAGQVNVIIHNAPTGADVQSRRNENGGLDVEVIFGQAENNMAANVAQGASPFNSAFERRYNLRPAV